MLAYLGFFVPVGSTNAFADRSHPSWSSVGITFVNLLGVRETAIVTNMFTVGKIVPLLIFCGRRYSSLSSRPISILRRGRTRASFAAAVLMLMYAYMGFEAAVIPAGETKDPQKSIPFALLVALAFCRCAFHHRSGRRDRDASRPRERQKHRSPMRPGNSWARSVRASSRWAH